MIRIKNQMVPARNGSIIQLECEVKLKYEYTIK